MVYTKENIAWSIVALEGFFIHEHLWLIISVFLFFFLGGIVINVVVGAEVATLCKLEEGCGVVIDEMPINVCAPFLKHPIWNLPISFTNKFENPVAEMVV
jgi:hypothetical protein